MNPFFSLHEASEVLNKYIMGMRSDNVTAGFFVSFLVTVFVPDIAVAAQLCSPQNAYRYPQRSFLKNISTLRHIPRPNGFFNKIS